MKKSLKILIDSVEMMKDVLNYSYEGYVLVDFEGNKARTKNTRP